MCPRQMLCGKNLLPKGKTRTTVMSGPSLRVAGILATQPSDDSGLTGDQTILAEAIARVVVSCQSRIVDALDGP